jgi:ribosomal protein S12
MFRKCIQLRLKGNLNSMLTLLPCNGSDVHSHVNVLVNTCVDRMSGYNDVAALSIHMIFMLLRKDMNVNEHERQNSFLIWQIEACSENVFSKDCTAMYSKK